MQLKTWRGRSTRTYKGYLAIFICLVTSAVHIEIVTDYTTEALSQLIKGSQDVEEYVLPFGALREKARLLANDGTRWIFNPPAAPHFGGKWEAAVKSTKFHLARVLGDTTLTYEELSTVVVQIEAVLNSRPLSPLSDNADDFNALTPGHFLIGEAPTTIPEPCVMDVPTSRLSRWQLLRQKVDQFWSRWSSECLQRYLAISKWHHPSTVIKK
ncbi:uncharacterized protein LOC118648049, partial [Monomorium pharaonis]|uniref:uncharacterized protein LOC118648049 n=1 Tax=Monomorium pharaonis TaxID=307658 RepID=UPI001747CB5B